MESLSQIRRLVKAPETWGGTGKAAKLLARVSMTEAFSTLASPALSPQICLDMCQGGRACIVASLYPAERS